MADDCAENEEQRPVAAAGSSYMLVSIIFNYLIEGKINYYI
jgi:hypothetical protein